METEKPVIRRRIEKSVSVKGVVTTSMTYESTGETLEETQRGVVEWFNWGNDTWPTPIPSP